MSVTTAEPPLLDAKQRLAYEAQGFLAVPAVFSPAEAEHGKTNVYFA